MHVSYDDLERRRYHLSIHLNAFSTDTGIINGPWDLNVPVPSLEKEICLYFERAELSAGMELLDVSMTATELQFSAPGKPDVKTYEPIAMMSDGTQVELLPSSMHCAAASERSISNPRPWAFWNGRQWNDSRKSSPASGMTGMQGKGRSFLTCHSMTKWCFSSSRPKRLDLQFLTIIR